jgi:ComF family protein
MTGREPRHHGCDECDGWPELLRFARSACLLQPPADRLAHELKYRGWPAVARPMGELMARVSWPREAHEPAVLVPVPTTDERRRRRGYNQAACLAEAVGTASARDVQPLLLRARGSRTQTALQPAARAANVAGAFVPAGQGIAGRHIILVDDVLTTGATAVECARVLHQAGACCVGLLTFARAFELRGLPET